MADSCSEIFLYVGKKCEKSKKAIDVLSNYCYKYFIKRLKILEKHIKLFSFFYFLHFFTSLSKNEATETAKCSKTILNKILRAINALLDSEDRKQKDIKI